jgi:rRNA-processing protein FCF1
MKNSSWLAIISFIFIISTFFVKAPEAVFILFFGFGFMIASFIIKELEDIKEILKEKEKNDI